jgi:hypothetical protein
MPGLLRGMARTAVVAGTATAVSNRVSRRQARKWGGEDQEYVPARMYPADQQQQQYAPPPQQEYAPPPPPPPAAPAPDRVAQLQQLAQLKEQGVLTDTEFSAEKARILSS